MVDVQKLCVSGIAWDNLLWAATGEGQRIVTYDPFSGKAEEKLSYGHEVWDVFPAMQCMWMMTGGGKLGRQIVFWSLEEARELKRFGCPEGAGAGFTLHEGKLWLPHRHNRKLYCLDPESGKVNWVVRTEQETFSPSAWRNELWLIESDPGPLAHWSAKQAKYFFSRFDPARERIVERLQVPFAPQCMAFDGERFWYAEYGKTGIASTKTGDRNFL